MLPDVPPIAEALPGYEATSWSGLMAPKGTPPEIVDKLNRDVNASLADPKVIERFIAIGGPPTPDTPAAFGRIIAVDTEKWAKVIKDSGTKAGDSDRTASRTYGTRYGSLPPFFHRCPQPIQFPW